MFVFCNIRCVTCIRVHGQLPNMLFPSNIFVVSTTALEQVFDSLLAISWAVLVPGCL
jgi:hypothetical protein